MNVMTVCLCYGQAIRALAVMGALNLLQLYSVAIMSPYINKRDSRKTRNGGSREFRDFHHVPQILANAAIFRDIFLQCVPLY